MKYNEYVSWLKEIAKEKEAIGVRGSWTYSVAMFPTKDAIAAMDILIKMGEW